ncbi:MAG: tautomerase family protein [Rhodanobacter sp.]
MIENVFTKEQKRQLITRLTDALVSVEGESMRGVTWCKIHEVRSGDWAIGGNPLSTGDAQALAKLGLIGAPGSVMQGAFRGSVDDDVDLKRSGRIAGARRRMLHPDCCVATRNARCDPGLVVPDSLAEPACSECHPATHKSDGTCSRESSTAVATPSTTTCRKRHPAIAFGRKNWLFAGSESAGQSIPAITDRFAKVNGLDPYAWLTDVLTCPVPTDSLSC